MFRHIRVLRALTLAAIFASAAAGPAAARFELNPPSGPTQATAPAVCSEVCSANGYGSASARNSVAVGSQYAATIAHRNVSPGSTPAPAHASGSGFKWGDAAIGAGGALLVMTLVAGGMSASSSVRRRPTRAAQPTG